MKLSLSVEPPVLSREQYDYPSDEASELLRAGNVRSISVLLEEGDLQEGKALEKLRDILAGQKNISSIQIAATGPEKTSGTGSPVSSLRELSTKELEGLKLLLDSNPTITELRILANSNTATADVLRDAINAQKYEKLLLQSETLIPQGLFEAIGNSQTIKTLDVWASSLGTEGARELSKAIAKNSSLTRLFVGDYFDAPLSEGTTETVNILAEGVGHSQSLETVSFSRNDSKVFIHDEAALVDFLNKITKAPRLRSLGIHGNKKVDEAMLDSIVTAIPKDSLLEYFNFDRDGISEEAWRKLESSYPKIKFRNKVILSAAEEYKLAKETQKRTAISEAIENLRLSKGKSLDLSAQGLNDEDVVLLLKQIEEADIKLKYLNLGFNNIGPIGAKTVAEYLANHGTGLETLRLDGNHIGDEGIAALSESLKGDYNAEELASIKPLKNVLRSELREQPEQLEVLLGTAYLGAKSQLKYLGLSNNGIADTGVSALASALECNGMLVSVGLNGNLIGNDGAIRLLEAADKSAQISQIGLGNNKLDTPGLSKIIHLKAYDDSVLDLDGNNFNHHSEEGRQAISRLLESNNNVSNIYQDYQFHAPESPRPTNAAVATLNRGYGFENDTRLLLPDISFMPPGKLPNGGIDLPALAAIVSAEIDGVWAPGEHLSLKNIDMLLASPNKEIDPMLDEHLPAESRVEHEKRRAARLEFANNVLIPHLDYFVISALRKEQLPEYIDFSDYPHIQKHVGSSYKLEGFKQAARKDRFEPAATKFAYLRDASEGDHMTRLKRAIREVDGTIGEYEGIFKAIDAQVAEIQIEIAQKRGLLGERGLYLKDARKANEFRTDRMQEYMFRLQASLDAANIKSAASGGRTLGQGAAMLAETIFDGVPILGGLSKKISQMVGVPNPIRAAGEAAMTQAIARTETRSSREIIEYYTAKQINEGAIEREIETVQAGVKKLESNADFKRLEQDKTKQKAIAEAFVNKLMLNFGQRMSDSLLTVCEEHGISKIDDFFAAFKGDPRLHEAFNNLCFGMADSNDLCVIFAEVAEMKGSEPAQVVAREYAETVLKSSIDDLYMHASKVDLIYQANLTGLGTDLHHARHMIRSEHDSRVRALFSDAFGVDSEMGSLTIRGAVDVKNLFDYYMHRHGKATLSDAKIHDGVMTENTAPKGVSVLSDTAMEKHKELAKRARGYRQDGPDISDMFLRICGYEYFVPQAPNDAQRNNIMANNPEAPASYQMANRVVKEFIQKLSFAHIDDYRAKIGTVSDEPSKLDNLIAQTFMDFFVEVGAIHAADPKLAAKRSDLKAASKETGTFGFAFDSYERQITKDALGRFDLFLEIYKRNLEVQLRDASVEDRKLLREQIASVAELTQQQLNPQVIEPGSEQDRHRARYRNHTFENTYWRGAM